jgi:hypothetical protein
MSEPKEEIIKRLTAERDCFKDLVERAAICMAMMQYGSIGCVGKSANVGEYIYKIGFNGDEYTATLQDGVF